MISVVGVISGASSSGRGKGPVQSLGKEPRALFASALFRLRMKAGFRAIFAALILLFMSALGVAQTAAPPPASLPPSSVQQPAQPQPTVETGKSTENSSAAKVPEQKITPQQAQQLFRSVDEILKFVSKDTGLPIQHPVKRQLADRDQVWRFIQARFEHDADAKRLQRSAVVLKKFGLLPRDFNLRAFLLKLLQEQVAGYYDTKTKTVYLLDWVPPEQQKPVLAHELTHALQDQNFGLREMTKAARDYDSKHLRSGERLAALQAVTEGQAMIVLLDYTLAPMKSSVARQPQLVDAMGPGLKKTRPGMVVFNSAPLFLQQALLFPYQYGAVFERDVLVAEGKKKAFAGVLKNLPQDTQQILHPQVYLDGQLVPPMKPLELANVAHAYQQWDESVLGEFDVRVLLEESSAKEAAKHLSSNWRGGYYWVALTPAAVKDSTKTPDTGDLALAYVSRWASAEAAQQFAAIYSAAVPKRYNGAYMTAGKSPVTEEDVPGMGLQVNIAPRLSGPVTWQTDEGLVTVEPQGPTVLVMESFDPETAAQIRQAVLGK